MAGHDDQLVGVSEAARYLEITAEWLRRLADRGALSVQRTSSGVRLFRVGDVRALKTQRDAAKQGAAVS